MRIGIDLGGTKIEGVVMAADSAVLARQRVATPQGDYAATLATLAQLVDDLETSVGAKKMRVGIGHPGALSPATGLLKNSNSICLNGQALQRDIERALQREVRMANDANCLALSEAVDGAAAGAPSVFAVILGTGVGGGIVVNGALLDGANGIAGEWGHNGLPRPRPEWNETPGPACWCGRHGCIETWLSGPALAADHLRSGGASLAGVAIVALAEAGDARAAATMSRFEDRLARSLASVINLLDPQVIVLGGGLSRIDRLYRHVPALWDDSIFSDTIATRLLPALHGDSSGVRGAARLWPAD
ncbi:ROK family protein [Hydrocarboniphaga sp.]|uniref:ROK family protein n=1 Tax=Hydrocarboniphaga sp. TaxID=2033016 RepID=UPI0034546B1B